MRRIVLAYDGSKYAERALRKAIQLSKSSKAELTIVNCVDLQAFESFAAKRLLARLRDDMANDAEKLVGDAALVAERDGLTTVRTLVIQDGDPANAILAAAAKESADMIVVGRRGVRGVKRFILGSVSSRIVDHAECDVLVVE